MSWISSARVQLDAAQVEQHDDEEEEDHDRAGVDQDLHGGDEVGLEQDEDRGEAEEHDHEPARRRHRVLAGDGQERRHEGDGREHAVEDLVHASRFA